jgi:hypothetical protein
MISLPCCTAALTLSIAPMGPLLLHTMYQHIHQNHLAFIESIENKIRLSSLPDFKHNVPEYLWFLGDNLKHITSTGSNEDEHNDLIPHILLQLNTLPTFLCSSRQY